MKKPNRAQRRKTELQRAIDALVRLKENLAEMAGYQRGKYEGAEIERKKATLHLHADDENCVDLIVDPGRPYVEVMDRDPDAFIKAYARVTVPEFALRYRFTAEPLERRLPNGTRVRWYNWHVN